MRSGARSEHPNIKRGRAVGSRRQARAKQLLAEAGYPNGFDAGDLYPWPPYTTMGEAVGGYLGAVGIKVRLRTMERAAFYSALASKKIHGLCVCINAVYGNAASRLRLGRRARG